MNVPTEVLGFSGSFILLCFGLWIGYLSKEIDKKVNSNVFTGAINRVDNELLLRTRVDVSALKEELFEEKFRGLDNQITVLSSNNAGDHNALKDAISAVNVDIREITETLAGMNKCLALLSERVPDKGNKSC